MLSGFNTERFVGDICLYRNNEVKYNPRPSI